MTITVTAPEDNDNDVDEVGSLLQGENLGFALFNNGVVSVSNSRTDVSGKPTSLR